MRLSLPFLSLLLGATSSIVAAAAGKPDDAEKSPERENTYFGTKLVPPILELTPDNFEKEVKASQWLFVKHHSPYCPHCKDFAPTWKTLYEFYYTSQPSGSGVQDADFTSFYNFRFAEINCVAYFDLCSKHDVQSYPTCILYNGGDAFRSFKGTKNMTVLSQTIEEALDMSKPGTRPRDLLLPTPGATAAPTSTAEAVPKDAPPKELRDEPAKEGETPATTELVVDQKEKTKTKPAKPTVTPNPNGLSVSLTAESFQRLVTMSQEPWFIKFYAPWCHHCQAMGSNWNQLAKEMKGKLNIGEVNCDVEKNLCSDAHVRAYPNVMFFRGGERVSYTGLRGLGDFVQFASDAIEISGGVQEVDADSLATLEEKEEVVFVYFYDHATVTEDFLALERLPLSLIGHAKLVKTNDPKLYDRFKISTWPRLLVSREGRPTYYNPLTPREMRDTRQVLNWMKSVWLPIVPELTASNAREIMDGKMVVLGILNRDDQDSFLSAKREMKSAANEWMDKQIQLFQLERQELRDAKQLRIEEAEDRNDQRALRAAKSIRINMDKSDKREIAFAWVDGVFWQRWIRTTYGIDVKDGERVIINDEDNRRYWDVTTTGNYIMPSRTSILETINKVVANPLSIKPRLTVSSIEKMFFDARATFSEHPYLTLGCIAGIVLGLASWFRGRLRRTRGHFRLDDNLAKELKAPVLGTNTNGKVD